MLQTEGFEHLTKSCPSIVTDLLECIVKGVKCSDISTNMVMKPPWIVVIQIGGYGKEHSNFLTVNWIKFSEKMTELESGFRLF